MTICLSALFVSMKILNTNSNIQPYEITYWQGLSSFFTFTIILYYLQTDKTDNFSVPKGARLPLVMRGLFGFCGNISAATSTKLTSLANFTVIQYTNPIFIAFLGVILLKEHLSLFDYVLILTTFLGVVTFTSDQLTVFTLSFRDLLGMSMALSCAIWTALAMMTIRLVGGRTHPLMLGLSWSMANVFLSPLLLLMSGHVSAEYGWFEVRHIAFICLMNVLCQVFLTLAFIKEKAARVAPIGAFQLIINC